LIANCDIVNRHKITMHVIICVVVVVVSKPELTRCKMRTDPAAAALQFWGGVANPNLREEEAVGGRG